MKCLVLSLLVTAACASSAFAVTAVVPSPASQSPASARADFPPQPYEPQVTRYSRAELDRGGWTNPYVTQLAAAAGNVLLDVQIGEGVTIRPPG